MQQRILLGPQRPVANLASLATNTALPDGPFAVISAGWQEAEGDIDDVHQLIGRPLVDLQLYARAEKVFAQDLRLRGAYRDRQDRLQKLQRLYRLRLRQLMIAARQMERAETDPDLKTAEQRHAISQLRALDRHHFNRIESIHKEYAEHTDIHTSPALAENAAAVEETLRGCETVIITGGNVVVLLNRLRLFGVHRLLAAKNLIAWSAGAMVLSDLIVLYHDRTPQGRRDAEVMGSGACVLPGFIFLPDAKRRLKDKDRVRVGLFFRRFAPAVSITLDSGSLLQFEGAKLRSAESAKVLTREGRLGRVKAA